MILLGELLLDLWFLVFFILSVILFRLIRHFLLLLDSHGFFLLLIWDELHQRHLIGKKVLVILEELLLLLSVFVELGELVEDHAALGYAVFI
jgi:hypothetical protein